MSLFSIALILTHVAFAAPPNAKKETTEFIKSAKSVSYRGQKIKEADPKSFQPTCPAEFLAVKGETLFCAMDSRHLFLGVPPKEPKSQVQFVILPRAPLRPLGRNHFQVGEMVFYKSLLRPVVNADFATFDELSEGNDTGIDSGKVWSYDYGRVYCEGQPVVGLTPKELAFWPFLSWDCKDLVSSQVGSLPTTGYIKDRDGVFVYVDCQLQSRLKDADPSTFSVPNVLHPHRGQDESGHYFSCGNPVTKRR